MERRLLAAASRLLAEEGPHALTVRRLAEEAGTTTMSLYSRFGGKQGIVDALYREGFAVLAAAQSEVMDDGNALDRLRAMCRTYRRVAREHATHYAVMTRQAFPDFEPTPASRQVAVATFTTLVTACAACVAEGSLRGNPEILAYQLFGLCHGMVSVEAMGNLPGSDEGEQRYDDAVAALLRGLV
ncbi:MAG: TetR/AcrR family transcriptional regulator [Myxococcota bacterium]